MPLDRSHSYERLGLLDALCGVVRISELERPTTRSLSVDRKLSDGNMRHENMKLTPTGEEAVDPSKNALVISGQALIHAIADYPDMFLKLGELCNSVNHRGHAADGITAAP